MLYQDLVKEDIRNIFLERLSSHVDEGNIAKNFTKKMLDQIVHFLHEQGVNDNFRFNVYENPYDFADFVQNYGADNHNAQVHYSMETVVGDIDRNNINFDVEKVNVVLATKTSTYFDQDEEKEYTLVVYVPFEMERPSDVVKNLLKIIPD